MKDFLELAKARFSVKRFADKPLEDDVLDKILTAGMVAPTAKNSQPQRVYVLKSAEALAKVRALTPCAFNAPVVLLIAYNKDEQWSNPLEAGIYSGVEDVSIVATHMMLAAFDLGVGSCWVNYFPNTETGRAFGLPDNEVPILLMPLGYAPEGAEPLPPHFVIRDKSELIKEL